jgi:hypothetical protein
MLAAGCSSTSAPAAGNAGGSGGGICVGCTDASAERSDLDRVTGALESSCGNPDGCHGAGAGGLGISIAGGLFTELIRVRSFEVPTLLRVSPGDPAQSYVYLKLACEGGIEGGCMPLDGPPAPSLVRAFHDWIEAGAPTR